MPNPIHRYSPPDEPVYDPNEFVLVRRDDYDSLLAAIYDYSEFNIVRSALVLADNTIVA